MKPPNQRVSEMDVAVLGAAPACLTDPVFSLPFQDNCTLFPLSLTGLFIDMTLLLMCLRLQKESCAEEAERHSLLQSESAFIGERPKKNPSRPLDQGVEGQVVLNAMGHHHILPEGKFI